VEVTIAVTACYPIETLGMNAVPGVRLIRTPVGERAPEPLEELPRSEGVSLLVATGFCGGLLPDLRFGDLVLADAVRHRGEEIRIDADLLDRARAALGGRARVGACESIPFVADLAAKQGLGDSGAATIDMESGPLARWATRREVPFLALRVVLDAVDDDLPFSSDRPIAASFLRHPIRAVRAARRAARAGRRLGDALNDLLPALKEES